MLEILLQMITMVMIMMMTENLPIMSSKWFPAEADQFSIFIVFFTKRLVRVMIMIRRRTKMTMMMMTNCTCHSVLRLYPLHPLQSADLQEKQSQSSGFSSLLIFFSSWRSSSTWQSS